MTEPLLQSPPPAPPHPSGAGAASEVSPEAAPDIETLADMRAYLNAHHGVTVDENDPTMLIYSIHRIFLTDYEKLLARHNRALTQVIGEAVSGLTDDTVCENLTRQEQILERIETAFKTQLKRVRILSALNVIATLVCLPVIVFLFLK